jgi:hypothetical protein
MMQVIQRARARKRGDSGDRGAAAVEFALIMPILIVLVFGTISFGIVFAQKLALGNGAREAARFGVVNERTCSEITTAAREAAYTIGIDTDQVAVSVKRGKTEATATAVCPSGDPPCESSSAGDSIWVQLDYTSSLLIPLVLIDDTFDIDGQGVFKCEFS